MAKSAPIDKLDEALIRKVASLAPGTQRWLKTTLLTIQTPAAQFEEGEHTEAPPAAKRQRKSAPATLEDVITGKADLRDQLEAYPELSEELDGMADIIDLLREAGARRRKRGEQILREEILGEKPEDDQSESE